MIASRFTLHRRSDAVHRIVGLFFRRLSVYYLVGCTILMDAAENKAPRSEMTVVMW